MLLYKISLILKQVIILFLLFCQLLYPFSELIDNLVIIAISLINLFDVALA